MSEISKDLQAQLGLGQDPLLRRFLEQKPDYDGPMLTPTDEERLKREERVRVLEDRIRAESQKGR